MRNRVFKVFIAIAGAAGALVGQSTTDTASSGYRFHAMAYTGQVIQGHRIARIGGVREISSLEYEDAGFQLGRGGIPVFYALTEQGFAGVFDGPHALAVEGGRFGDRLVGRHETATIQKIINFATGGGVAVAAAFSSSACPDCKGVFVNDAPVLQLDATAQLGSMVIDSQGNVYTVVTLANPPLRALYRNDKPIVKTGDHIMQGQVVDFLRGMLWSQSDDLVAVPMLFTSGKPPRRDSGLYLNGAIISPAGNVIGLTTNHLPIVRDATHLRVGEQVLFTGHYNMQPVVIDEHNFAVKSLAPGGTNRNQEAIYTSTGLVILPEQFGALTGIADCCLFVGKPAINWRGDVAFRLRSKGSSFKTAIVVGSKYALSGIPAISSNETLAAQGPTTTPGHSSAPRNSQPKPQSPVWSPQTAATVMERFGIRLPNGPLPGRPKPQYPNRTKTQPVPSATAASATAPDPPPQTASGAVPTRSQLTIVHLLMRDDNAFDAEYLGGDSRKIRLRVDGEVREISIDRIAEVDFAGQN